MLATGFLRVVLETLISVITSVASLMALTVARFKKINT